MRSRFTLVLTLLVSTTFLGAAPAHADEPKVSVYGTTTFTGHGFGHGRGMSQYGARGRAIKAWKASSILNFYYPGTTLSNASGDIRIWLKGDIDSDTIVLPKAGLSITDSATGKTYKLPTTIGATSWRLTGSGASSGFKLSYSKNGWHSYLPGGHSLSGYGEFRTSAYTITVKMPGGNKSYRGAIQRRNGHTINRTSFDSYVKGVVAAEMPPTWPMEALKSQAIAARTFGAYSKATSSGPSDTWNVDDTTNYQVYGGLAAETSRTNQAVVGTAGKILTYAGAPDNGGPAYTQFSSSNGGWTVAGDTKPYLVAAQDTYEQYGSNPYANWTYAPSQSTLQTKLEALASDKGTDIGTLKYLQVVDRDGHGEWGGRVLDIRLIGTKASIVVGGSDLRFAIGLRSTWFQLAP
ncbi:SpoIID/LytB domain-containing protein [Nocardioides marmorisolisilvae]|uniref:SpoIID/LytB domain-containing protein n=1 Tax=Nocardioides marmorisolisilvae TaxID=1542737 RepID=A0A3N0DSK0_9ACTN|nr:SpoIID/LytB domain-containing protein [Nocardioides marmorisolisilvae]RNL78594.1 SpoIID/LytB domain-containing protein [Nocardioides marmorisolisilvae]